MKTVTISDEAAAFLAKLAETMVTQDNRCSAAPYYFVVRCVKELAAPVGQTGVVRYFDRQQCESYTEEELREQCKENGEDFDDYVFGSCEKYDLQEVEEFENVFFTFDGYKEHMALYGHNYRHFKSVDSYVKHARMNPEMASLVGAIKEIGGALKVAPLPAITQKAEEMRWRSVKTDVPHTDDEVLCRDEIGCFVGRYYADCDSWDTDNTEHTECPVTHWMPLPPLPAPSAEKPKKNCRTCTSEFLQCVGCMVDDSAPFKNYKPKGEGEK